MNNADKRSVHTDALETLGTIIGDTEARDAIHLAVEPVTAGTYLEPGQRIGRYPNGQYGPGAAKIVGIVDPFLDGMVNPGEKFWLVIMPRMITSLRHVWTHPDFEIVEDLPKPAIDLNDPKAVARRWIEDYAQELSGVDYGGYDDGYREVTADELIDYARTWVNPGEWGGDYLVKGGLLEGVGTRPEFWDHFETLTGLRASPSKYDSSRKPNFFSCSC